MKQKSYLLSIIICSLLFSLIGRAQMIEPMQYKDGAQKFNGWLGLPKINTKKKAGVLVLPAWMGIDENAKASAKKLSILGYYTLVADIYGEGNYPTDMKQARELSTYYKNNVDAYRKRIQLALDQLVNAGADPNNIVVIGYCFGGTGALEAARANMHVKAVVSFHGGLARDTTKTISQITPKVLVCHGAADFFVPESQVKAFQNEMNQSKADWQMVYYANAVHSFTDRAAGNNPATGAAYNEKAATRSWELFLQFLEEVFS